jgi:hypothetical protein
VAVAVTPGKDRIIRTQSARHRVDHGTICRRSCANSGHYKVLWACVDRTRFVAPASVAGSDFSLEPAEGAHFRSVRKPVQRLKHFYVIMLRGNSLNTLDRRLEGQS